MRYLARVPDSEIEGRERPSALVQRDGEGAYGQQGWRAPA